MSAVKALFILFVIFYTNVPLLPIVNMKHITKKEIMKKEDNDDVGRSK